VKKRVVTIHDQQRRGMITPMIVFALLVVMACTALVLDRLWLDAAKSELTTAAEVAALEACRNLANDDQLRENSDNERRIETARNAAAEIARLNRVAGLPVELDTSPGGDILFGNLVEQSETGETIFLTTDQDPRTVVVTARRTRRGGNPIALFFRGVTRQGAGDAVALAEASIDNRVIGVRPIAGTTCPVLPIAILKNDPSAKRTDTWDAQIVQQQGLDRYSFNETANRVDQVSDGIREIVLTTYAFRGDPNSPNVHLLVLPARIPQDWLPSQIRNGLTEDDLHGFGGQLIVDGTKTTINTTGNFSGNSLNELEQIVGECRICLLYDKFVPNGTEGAGRAECVELVAGRVMHIQAQLDGSLQITFQPSVIATRSAVIASADNDNSQQRQNRNRYIYKIALTY